MDKEALAKNIQTELYNRLKNSKTITLDMKKGYTIVIEEVYTGPYKSCHHWHSGKLYYKVKSSRETEVRYFKFLSGIAKSMAYGYL